MGRNEQLIRQWNIIKQLDSKFGVTVTQLMQEFRVTRRTIERDLAALQEVGFPIYDEFIEREKRWKFVAGFQSQLPIPFTLSELLNLYFSRHILDTFSATPFKPELESLCTKLQSLLPEKTLQYLDRIHLVFQPRNIAVEEYPYAKLVMPELEQAILDETAVKMEYFSNTKNKWRTYLIEPYAIFTEYNRLYLSANVPKHENICTFNISRIRKIESTGTRFKKPKEFSIAKYMGTAFGIIRDEPQNYIIRFKKEVIDFVKSRCHHLSPTCKALPNGNLELRMRASSWDEIKWWLFSFGDNAEVIEPKQMRAEIKHTLQTTLKNYSKK
ncbi:MAG: transcriptional regulator [bacterium]|nr:transcriptional regulator [bacterium]